MLQVGPFIDETARSFASWARIFKPTSSMSATSHVAPNAVPDWSHIRSAGDYWINTLAYWYTICGCTHKVMSSSNTIRTIAKLEVPAIVNDRSRYEEWHWHTLMAGIQRRSTDCEYQRPSELPAVRRIASAVVKSFKTLSMSAVAKSDGGIYCR